MTGGRSVRWRPASARRTRPAVLLVVLMIGGCTGTTSTGAARSGRWHLAIDGAEPATAGRQYDLLFRQPNQLPHGASQGVLAVQPGPRLLTAYSPPSKGMTIAQGRITWTGAGPHEVIAEPAVPGPPRQTIYGTADAGGLVWVETASTDLDHQDWHVFYHPNGGNTRLVADSVRAFPGQRMYIPVGANPITLTPSDVVWSTSNIRPSGKVVASDLMAADRSSSAPPRVLVSDAGLPASVGEELFYVATSQLLPARYTTQYRIEELSGRRRLVVRSGTYPQPGRVVELGGSADYVAWTWAPTDETVPATISVLDRTTGSLGIITLAQQDWSAQLSISGHYLAWGNGSSNGEGGEYLVDLASRHLWKLGSSPGYSTAFVAGRDVVWAEPAAGGVTMVAGRWRS